MANTPRNPFDFFSPWVPGPMRRSARAYAQWMASNMGATPEQMQSRLTRFFELSGQVAGRLAAAAQRFAGELKQFSFAGKSTRLDRASIPRDAAIPAAYRVVATVRLRNPSAARRSRDPEDTKHITVVLDFDHNPTIGEIRDAARNMATVELPGAGSPRAKDVADWKYRGVDVEGVYRRT